MPGVIPAERAAAGQTDERHGCALWFGLALAVVAAGLIAGWLGGGISWWTALLGAGVGLLALGALARAAGAEHAFRLIGAGAALVLGPWLVRAVWVGGSERARLTVLPDDSGPRLLDKLYPEQDGTLLAARLVGLTGHLRDAEAQRFPQILREAYERTDPSSNSVPTPAIATYLGLQSSAQFDTLIITPPRARAASDAALIFLHGYAGNFYVYCWEIAQAAAAANLLTLCPATGPKGDWWTASGEQTLAATLDYARRIGMHRIYLSGLSNGAAGASVLALTHSGELAGLVLVSGVRADRPPPLPTLVVQGSSDQLMPVALARAYAARGPRVTYRELAGGHLIFLSEHDRVRAAIAAFLSGLEQRAPGSPAFVPPSK